MADQATSALGQDSDAPTVIIDSDVSATIAQEARDAHEAELSKAPGLRWREVSATQDPNQVAQVLASNPFAPFVLPLALALAACGVLEKLLAYRRERRPSDVSFA